MVSLKAVQLSNAGLKDADPTTAVFVGATSGIGASAARQLARTTKSPKIYLIGRSKAKSSSLLTELSTLNPEGTFTFIEAEASLIKEVDKACDEIKAKEQKIDLVWVSTGTLSFAGRQDTKEGLALILALAYYSRLRFVSNLLPLLSKSPSPRVVTILGAGKETSIITPDMELAEPANYSLPNAMNQTASMTTMAFDELAKSYPTVSFIHTYPGIVNTGLLDKLFGSFTGIWGILGTALRYTLLPIMGLFQVSPEEAGERGLFVATSEKYKEGGLHRLDWNGDDAKDVAVIEQYKHDGMGKKVWEHTVGVYDKILQRA